MLSKHPRERLLIAAKEVYGRNVFAPRSEVLSNARVGKATLRRYFGSLENLRESTLAHVESAKQVRHQEGRLDLRGLIPSFLRGMKLHTICTSSRICLWQQYRGGPVFGLTIRRFVKTQLFVAGVCLFAGEGTKSLKARKVELVNSDPTVIRIFVNFLSTLGISSKKLTLRIQTDKCEIDAAKRCWMKILSVQPQQFQNPITKRGGTHKGRSSLVVMYPSTILQLLLNYWITQLEKLV